VSIVTRLWAGGPGFDCWQGQVYFSLRHRCVQTVSGDLCSLLSNGYVGLFLRG